MNKETLLILYERLAQKFEAIGTLKPETDTRFEAEQQFKLVEHLLMDVSEKYIEDSLTDSSNLNLEELGQLLRNQTKIILGLTDLVLDFSEEYEELYDTLQQDKAYIKRLTHEKELSDSQERTGFTVGINNDR